MDSKINLSKFDMYSKRIGFFFNNHEKIGSYFGLLLTLIYIFASIILFIYQIVGVIKRNEMRVYDTTIYDQKMPVIDADIDQLYFAFALEDPLTTNRFIDESIYTAKVAFIDKVKKNDEFVTVNTTYLNIEKCNIENFGKKYQHLLMKDELSNSYCLKDFNYTLTFAGSYKYERITYIRLRIYPCVNSTKNNYSCKPQEEIDRYLSSGYFSIVIKDFGLNPSNYSSPVVPTFQDLYTTIDKRIYRNYILNFGVTEIRTDTGLVNENIKIDKYLQYRRELQTFSFRDEKDYYEGKSVILVQLRLDDTILVQTRSYIKLSEIFSRIGGYMQLMNTAFLLISSIVNKVNAELKVINSIFDFNIKENKMILKLHSLNDLNLKLNIRNNKKSSFNSKKSISEIRQLEYENRSKNELIIKDNDNISILNISENRRSNNNNDNNQNFTIKIKKNKNVISFEEAKNGKMRPVMDKSQNYGDSTHFNRDSFPKNLSNVNNKENQDCKDNKDCKENKEIQLNIFNYYCYRTKTKKYKYIDLYNRGNFFYRNKMDIIHVFSLLSVLEDFIKKK
jgi:hypothetical protein